MRFNISKRKLILIILVLLAAFLTLLSIFPKQLGLDQIQKTVSTLEANKEQAFIPKHIFLIVFENKEYSDIIGNKNAPFFNSLASKYGLGTNFFAITHPSLPNYLALIGGSTFGVKTDCEKCFVAAGNLADKIEASDRTWKAYFEDMPKPCFVGSASPYAQKHNPFIYFDNIRLNKYRCEKHLVPFSEFSTDLKTNASNFIWITPNLCNDMHDCPVRLGDTWLEKTMAEIFNSNAYQDGGVVFITFDEGVSKKTCCANLAQGGQIATIIASNQAKKAFTSDKEHTQYDLLRTIEAFWSLSPMKEEINASPMSEFFEKFPTN